MTRPTRSMQRLCQMCHTRPVRRSVSGGVTKLCEPCCTTAQDQHNARRRRWGKDLCGRALPTGGKCRNTKTREAAVCRPCFAALSAQNKKLPRRTCAHPGCQRTFQQYSKATHCKAHTPLAARSWLPSDTLTEKARVAAALEKLQNTPPRLSPESLDLILRPR